jgi:hypothetical protein
METILTDVEMAGVRGIQPTMEAWFVRFAWKTGSQLK